MGILLKLTMIENEVAHEGEDDTVNIETQSAACFVDASSIRSIHERKLEEGIRKSGTRIAFVNGSQFSVTESVDTVAAALGYVAPTALN